MVVVPYAAAADPTLPPGPRGQPIRPPGSRSAPANVGTVVTLPGGTVLTNLPASVLPKSPTNTIRLPTHAARKFEPLGYLPTSFTVLARFFVHPPEPGSPEAQDSAARWETIRRQIPEDVIAMDGRKVALAGFILPLALADGRATEFLLLRTQSACCFGLVPRVNELVVVKVAPPGITPRPDTPVVVAGTLTVKWVGEGDQLMALYEMRGDQVEPAQGF